MKKIYTLFVLALSTIGVLAQDVHFSQFYNAPLWLNPAFTGFHAGVARVGVNYRNQWFSAMGTGFGKSPFMTTALSFDMPIKIRKDVLGAGLFLANDQQGANTFTGVIANVSAAYIKTLGKEDNHRLSAGFQAGYTFYNIKTQNFQWANQFQDNVFNGNINSNEILGRNNTGYVNLNFGLFWYGKFNDVVSMYAGGSFYNVTTPKFNVLNGQKRDLYWRWNVHSGLDITVSERYHILPSGMFTRMGVNDQLNTGLGFGVDFNQRSDNPMGFTLGLYNRIHNITKGVTADGLIPYAAFNISGFKIALSYDATLSNLRNSGSGVGALEFYLAYVFKKRDYNFSNALICPRF